MIKVGDMVRVKGIDRPLSVVNVSEDGARVAVVIRRRVWTFETASVVNETVWRDVLGVIR